MKAMLTLGPASSDEAVIAALLDAADAFRLNASHLAPDALRLWLEKVAGVFRGRTIPVYVDLQGAKMRIGSYPATDRLPERVWLVLGAESMSADRIPVPHEALFEAIGPGDSLTLNDNRIALRVESCDGSSCQAIVERNGPLSSRKGINRAHHPVPCTRLTDADRQAVEIALAWPFTRFAFSFVVDGSEAALLRPLTGDRPLAAKIERPEAMPHLEAIATRFDELWLCRGDLGAQAGLRALGALQEEFVARSRARSTPYWLAGQVLEHMTHFPQPTRAEVVALHQAGRDGFTGIVLSDETAVGKHPLDVASFLLSMR